MCREFEKLVMAERAKSRAEGFAEGYAEGFAEGYGEGLAEGRLERKIGNIRAIMENLSVSVDDAMKLLKTPESNGDIIRSLIEQ